MKYVLILLVFVLNSKVQCQIPAHRLGNWNMISGVDTAFAPLYVQVSDFNASNSKNIDSALNKAIQFVASQGGGTVLIGAGVFYLTRPVVLKSHVRVKGIGPSTEIHLKFGQNTWSGFELKGNRLNHKLEFDSISSKTIFTKSNINDSNLKLVKFNYNDTDLMNNSWAYGTVGQLLKVKQIIGNRIELDDSIHLSEAGKKQINFSALNPIIHASVECLSIIRDDSAHGQASNILIENAYMCRINAVESYKTNFAHISINNSSLCQIDRNYLHHSFGYGGGGQGYGIVLQQGSYKNLITDNICKHLRHSFLLQSGANHNIISYNYSTDPFVTDNILQDAGGDLVCHGNYPYKNLFEGNICQTAIIDNSHGKNGPFNTFFRNRLELYGIIVSANQDSQNFIANEITNTNSLKGIFTLNGSGHFRANNAVRNIINDKNNYNYPNSMYAGSLPEFWNIPYRYWGIGYPFIYQFGSNPATKRYHDSLLLYPCDIPIQTSSNQFFRDSLLMVYPNPAKSGEKLYFSKHVDKAILYDYTGKIISIYKQIQFIKLPDLSSGIYYISIDSMSFKLIIE